MPRKHLNFKFYGSVSLSFDTKEFKGCTVREIEAQVREAVRAEAGVYDVDEGDIQRAAVALAGNG